MGMCIPRVRQGWRVIFTKSRGTHKQNNPRRGMGCSWPLISDRTARIWWEGERETRPPEERKDVVARHGRWWRGHRSDWLGPYGPWLWSPTPQGWRGEEGELAPKQIVATGWPTRRVRHGRRRRARRSSQTRPERPPNKKMKAWGGRGERGEAHREEEQSQGGLGAMTDAVGWTALQWVAAAILQVLKRVRARGN
jgi:hypothetical protein